MHCATLGSTDLFVSALGLGTVELGMPYGLGKPSPPDDATCIRLLQHAADRGVSYVDTAAAYGRSEELIGRAFAGRPHPIIATKVTMRDADGTPWTGGRIAPEIRASIDRSRRLLGVETLDLVQIHNAEAAITGDEDLLAAMQDHLLAGDVRYWGASTYGEQAPLAVIRQGPPMRTLQIAYSVLDRTLESQVIPACGDAGIGLILRSVFLQGVLSERRHTLPEHLADHLAELREAANAVARIAEDLGQKLPAVGLRFALYESGAQVALVGTADIAELDANVDAALAGPLPPDATAALREIRVVNKSLLNPGTWPVS
ncbi:MAG: aldo/keto reductase [bacterium]|nr:aldo/keto reductase [bacterium]